MNGVSPPPPLQSKVAVDRMASSVLPLCFARFSLSPQALGALVSLSTCTVSTWLALAG